MCSLDVNMGNIFTNFFVYKKLYEINYIKDDYILKEWRLVMMNKKNLKIIILILILVILGLIIGFIKLNNKDNSNNNDSTDNKNTETNTSFKDIDISVLNSDIDGIITTYELTGNLSENGKNDIGINFEIDYNNNVIKIILEKDNLYKSIEEPITYEIAWSNGKIKNYYFAGYGQSIDEMLLLILTESNKVYYVDFFDFTQNFSEIILNTFVLKKLELDNIESLYRGSVGYYFKDENGNLQPGAGGHYVIIAKTQDGNLYDIGKLIGKYNLFN